MKKLFLSALMATAMMASATEVTFDFTDPASLNPAQVLDQEEVNGTTTTMYKNLAGVSLTSGDVTFLADTLAGVKAISPRLWTTSSGIQFRCYKNNTFKFTCSKGDITAISFEGNNYALTAATASVGTFTPAATKVHASWAGKTNDLLLTLAADIKTVQLKKIIVTIDGEVDPNPPTPPTPAAIDTINFVKADKIEEGVPYIFVSQDGKIGSVINETYSYGRLALIDPISNNDGIISTTEDNTVKFSLADKDYLIVDYFNRYLSMDTVTAHQTSFQLYTTEQPGSKWTASFAQDGTVDLTNVANAGCQVGQAYKNDSTLFTNIAPAAPGTKMLLPFLYCRYTESGMASVAADSNAPVEYYNLQGVRVNNPERGLFIRVKGKKATKVIL